MSRGKDRDKERGRKSASLSAVANESDSFSAPRVPHISEGIRLLVASFVVVYVAYRIVAIDLTSDEWGSLKDIIRKGVADLITFKYVDAQSHFLQSLFSMFSLQLFPEAYEVVAIRLPTLVGLLAYLYGAYRVTSLIKVRFLSVLGFVALCANAFMLDYFGLARGYGFALGFLMLSLWHVLKVFLAPAPLNGRGKHFHLALWFGGLAVLSNLAWLCYYGALCVMLLWHTFESEAGGRLADRLWRTLIAGQSVIYNALLVGVFYLPRVILLTERGALYFGGVDGFVRDTVHSLVKGVFYVQYDRPHYLYMAYGITVFCGAAALVSVARWWRENSAERRPLVRASGVISAILLISAAVTECMNLFFNVKFVIERAATGFLVVGVCQLVLFAASVSRMWRVGVIAVLSLYIMIGAANLNLNRTSIPWYCQMREFVSWVGDVRAKDGRQLIIGTDSGCNFTIWYYLERMLGLTESEQTRASVGFVRIFNGVTIYSVDLPGDKALFDDNTDYLLLKHVERQGKYPRTLRLVRRFRNADLDLFACEGGRVSKPTMNKEFNGVVYPMRFDRQ